MVNTLDFMVGYRNEKYLCFKKAVARIDGLAKFIPARLAILVDSVMVFVVARQNLSAVAASLVLAYSPITVTASMFSFAT